MINGERKPNNLDKKMIKERNKEYFPFELINKLQRHWNTAGYCH